MKRILISLTSVFSMMLIVISLNGVELPMTAAPHNGEGYWAQQGQDYLTHQGEGYLAHQGNGY
ncbi:MAG: hypothetical protein AAF587_34325 [Bacteroidota bacterium]